LKAVIRHALVARKHVAGSVQIMIAAPRCADREHHPAARPEGLTDSGQVVLAPVHPGIFEG
jgi:hypothetical protein